MFCLLQCPTIMDSVSLKQLAYDPKKIARLQAARDEIKALSDSQYLISQIQKDEPIMMKKVAFDIYLKQQVQLMKASVSLKKHCQFSYKGFFTDRDINTVGMELQEHWGFQMVMSRYILCIIYHAGSYSSLGKIFSESANSFHPDYNKASEYSKNLQVVYSYFYEGYQPLERLLGVYDDFQKLFSPQNIQKYPQIQKVNFQVYKDVIFCNLAYIKLEKLRILHEHKACMQGAYSVMLRLQQIQKQLKKSMKGREYNKDLKVFIEVGQMFYKLYTLYFMVLVNDKIKQEEEYGFIKKEFQQMIADNLVAIEQINLINSTLESFPNGKNLDNVIFALSIANCVVEEANKIKFKYAINIHQNKLPKPRIQDVMDRNIKSRDILEDLKHL